MPPTMNIRTFVVYVLVCSLVLSGAFTLTTGQGHASNISLTRFLTPRVKESSEETVQTTSTGIYTFTSLPAGRNYTLKPTKTGFTFTPATKSITNLSNNIGAGAATNFTGTGP